MGEIVGKSLANWAKLVRIVHRHGVSFSPHTCSVSSVHGFPRSANICRGTGSSPNSSSSLAAAMTTSSDSQLDAIFEKKRCLRSQIRKQLRSMSPALRSEEDIAIQNTVLEAPWFKSSHRLCAYVSCDSLREVDTSRILSQILTKETEEENCERNRFKRLYLPRIEDKNSNMKMLRVETYNDLVANSMNILEPSPVVPSGDPREEAMLADDPVDLFILPGLAFDKSGRRLGRSGGYYDSYLKRYQDLALDRKWKRPLLVALAYSTQILEEEAIPVTSNDFPVDVIVSPAGVIKINSLS